MKKVEIITGEQISLSKVYPITMKLMEEIEQYDTSTYEHSVRVARYIKQFGKALNLTEQEQGELYIGGLLHDLGKIFIPNEYITKESKLTNREYEEVKTHAVKGYEYLRTFDSFGNHPNILDMVKYHHERIDGSGYPTGTKEIPLTAKMLGIVDSFDAMVRGRTYQPTKPIVEAFRELEKGAGTLYDGQLVTIFDKEIEGKYKRITWGGNM